MVQNKPSRRSAVDICDAARAASCNLTNMLDSRAEKRRRNFFNIASACEHLLVTKPITEPTAETVAQTGSTLFPYFPRKQTLNNDYSPVLNVWRIAYAEILRLKPRRSSPAALRITHQDDYEQEIGILKAEIAQLSTDLGRARAIIANQALIPLDLTKSTPSQHLATISLINVWLTEIREMRSVLCPLELTPTGLKVSTRGRPGMVVMKPELIEEITRSL